MIFKFHPFHRPRKGFVKFVKFVVRKKNSCLEFLSRIRVRTKWQKLFVGRMYDFIFSFSFFADNTVSLPAKSNDDNR